MNIFYDHQIFTEQNYGGISRYFVELFKRYPTIPEYNLSLPKFFTNNSNIKEINLDKINSYKTFNNFLPKINFRGKYRIFRILQNFRIYKDAPTLNLKNSLEAIDNLKIDIIHPTYYSNYFIDIAKIKNIPYVITVYDMIHELYPHFFLDANLVIANKKKSILNASLILAISHNTKKDIMSIYNIPSERIEVTHLASNIQYLESENDSIQENYPIDDYILYVGNRSIYKNFLFFLESIEPILKNSTKLKLYCLGGGNPNFEELSLINQLGLAKKILFFPILNNYDLYNYYKNAKLFIFPSLYEGFGIPLLEAMNSNCLVACSNTSSFNEVAGDAAFYFNPYDKLSIRDTIYEALNNTTKREEKYKEIVKQRSLFSWDITFDKTILAYKLVAKT